MAEINGGRSTHFVTEGEYGKGQCHHKRHGKDYHVHIAIISHIGHLQQFCYIYVTLLWPILNDTAGDVPGNYVIATIYDTVRRCDFFVINRAKFPNDLIIKCKWQQSSGSVDEKHPFLYFNIIKTGIPTVVLLTEPLPSRAVEIHLILGSILTSFAGVFLVNIFL
jgi:hypothetical protein